MKVLILGDHKSSHIIKWVTSLNKRGIMISIFSLNSGNLNDYESFPDIEIIRPFKASGSTSLTDKVKYLTAIPLLKKSIKRILPDIVHAHYATSYGLLGAQTAKKNFVLSVWGDDVFVFPKSNPFNRWVFKRNLSKANRILSTSHIMAKEIKKYTTKSVVVTPFGIDLSIFKPSSAQKETNIITIGTVKTMAEKYGIQYLIEAFSILYSKYGNDIRLLLVGGGPSIEVYKEKVKELDIERVVEFTNYIPYSRVHEFQQKLDISVSLSISDGESFGVAIVEASACSLPVVVSNVGGLPEVVEDGVTGIVVEPRNAESAATAIEKLILDQDLRHKMGKKGRERVQKLYDWKKNVTQMISIYDELVQ